MPPEDLNKQSDISLFGNADPLVGQVLSGRWEIQAFLGEGSMSSAYRARDSQTGTKVVVKMLHQHLVANNKNLKRFEQRARTFMMLVNDRIGRVFDVQLTNQGGVYIVVEALQGESLEDLLAKSGHLSADHAVDVFIAVCEGLEFAHEQEVLHRDLKPSNIMLVEAGGLSQEVKLVDFGVAKLLSEDTDDVKTSGYITRTREVFGSPMYMSPEQCMGKKLDGRSDIYSLGCVMYETLTGKPPFVGKNVLETAYKHMNETPKSFASERPGDRYLSRFESIIFKCLAKDPNDRYASVSQLKSDLQALPISNEVEWTANAYCLQKMQRKTNVRNREVKKRPIVSFEVIVFVAASVLLAVVVGVWSFSFLGQENQEYPDFNNATLWIVKEKKAPQSPVDFGTREETAKIELSTIENEKGVESREYAGALRNLIVLYLNSGHYSDAVICLHKLIEATKKTGAAPVSLPQQYADLSMAHFMQNQLEDAEVAATNALEEAERAGLSSTQVVLTPLKILGDIYSQKNELDKATDIYEKLYNVVEPKKYQVAMEFAYAAAWLGDIYRRQDKLDYAERYYRQALEMSKTSFPGKNLFVVKTMYGLGLVLEKEGNYKEAEQFFREALPMAKEMAGSRAGITGGIKKQLMEVLWKTNPVSAVMERMKPDKDNNEDALDGQ